MLMKKWFGFSFIYNAWVTLKVQNNFPEFCPSILVFVTQASLALRLAYNWQHK